LKVGAAGVEVDRSKTAAVEEARAPRTKTALRRFLGMTGYYRKFIDQYATKAAPLTKYLKDDTAEPFDLGVEALEAHQNLKTAIVTAPVLALPKSKGMFVLETMRPPLSWVYNSFRSRMTRHGDRSDSGVANVIRPSLTTAQRSAKHSQLFGELRSVGPTSNGQNSKFEVTTKL
jgi:hypothetical protein